MRQMLVRQMICVWSIAMAGTGWSQELAYDDFTGLISDNVAQDPNKFWHDQPAANLALSDAGGRLTADFNVSTCDALIWSPQLSPPLAAPGRYLVMRFDLQALDSVGNGPPDGHIQTVLQWTTSQGGAHQGGGARLLSWQVTPNIGWQTVIVDLQSPGVAPDDLALTECSAGLPVGQAEPWGAYPLEQFFLRVGWAFGVEDDKATLAHAGNYCRISYLGFLDNWSSFERQYFVDYFLGLRDRPETGVSQVWQYYGDGKPLPDIDRIRWPGDIYVTSDKKDVISSLYPRVGKYDTTNPDIAEYQILTAKAAGLDGFMCEWETTGIPFASAPGDVEENTQAMETLAQVGALHDFDVGIHWSSNTIFLRYNYATRNEYIQQSIFDLQYVLDNIYSGGQGARIDRKPVIPVFGVNDATPMNVDDPWLTPSEVNQIRVGLSEDVILLARPLADGDLDNWILPSAQSGDIDGFYAFGQAFGGTATPPWTHLNTTQDQVNYLQTFSADVKPAYDNGDVRYVMAHTMAFFDNHKTLSWAEGNKIYTPYSDGQTLQNTLAEFPSTAAQAMMVRTWNDYGENTGVEPTRELGFEPLEIIAQQIQSWGHFSYNAEVLRQPERLLMLRRGVQRLIAAGVDPVTDVTLSAAIVDLDTAAGLIADGKAIARFKLNQAEAKIVGLLDDLTCKRLSLKWQADEAGEIDLTLPTGPFYQVIVRDGLEGISAPSPVIFDVPEPYASTYLDGVFEGTMTVEYLDVATPNAFFFARVDAQPPSPGSSDPDKRIVAHDMPRGTDRWREIQFDFVNARMGNHISQPPYFGIGDFKFELEVGGNLATLGIRSVKLEGFVYSAN